MNLLKIKELVETGNYPGGIRTLAEYAGLSDSKLYRCITDNKIPAQDLERIAKLLRVPVSTFFDEEERNKTHTEGNMSPISTHGNITYLVGTPALEEKVKELELQIAQLKDKVSHLDQLLAEKDCRIAERDERISELKSHMDLLYRVYSLRPDRDN